MKRDDWRDNRFGVWGIVIRFLSGFFDFFFLGRKWRYFYYVVVRIVKIMVVDDVRGIFKDLDLVRMWSSGDRVRGVKNYYYVFAFGNMI